MARGVESTGRSCARRRVRVEKRVERTAPAADRRTAATEPAKLREHRNRHQRQPATAATPIVGAIAKPLQKLAFCRHAQYRPVEVPPAARSRATAGLSIVNRGKLST